MFPCSPAARGFTLIELMISIAIALILIVGINQVFSIAQKTAGAGNQLSQDVRDFRMFQGRVAQDARSIVLNDAPFFIIVGESQPAFRNKSDQTAAPDPKDPTKVNNPFGGAPIRYSLAAVNDRVHRIDRLMFFARDLFTRQTGNYLTISSATSGYEAYLWYGHLRLPNNNTISSYHPDAPALPLPSSLGWYSPGQLPDPSTQNGNDNNYFASDWILGRQQMLLIPPPGPLDPMGRSEPANSNTQPQGILSMMTTPQSYGSARQGIPHPVPIYASRYDVALTSIDAYRQFVSFVSAPQWMKNQFGAWEWAGWRFLAFDSLNQSGSRSDARFYGNPFVQRAKPMGTTPVSANQAQLYLAAGAAQAAPILVRGCTHFIVEYAGSFLKQDTNPTSTTFGKILGPGPDDKGTIDFIAEPANGASGPPWTRRTRWYGFPRDIDGDGHISVFKNGGSSGAQSPDVLPLRDVLRFANPPLTALAFRQATQFERQYPTQNPSADYPTQGGPLGNFNSNSPDPLYVCAWGPDTTTLPRPKLLRITLAIDDPAARLNDAQMYEYVIELP